MAIGLRVRHDVVMLRKVILTFVVIVVSACVETDVIMVVNSDGSGRTIVQQVFPNLLMPNLENKLVEVESNELIMRSEEEAKEIWGDKAGITLRGYAITDINAGMNGKLPLAMQGMKHVQADLDFEKVDDLSLDHFRFRFFERLDGRYFMINISKTLKETHINQPHGGMGIITASAVEGRFVNFKITLPGRVIEHNATDQEWNTLTWKMPVAAIYNSVQEDLIAWAKIVPSGNTLESVWSEAKYQLNHEEWMDTDTVPPYFLLPVVEPQQQQARPAQ